MITSKGYVRCNGDSTGLIISSSVTYTVIYSTYFVTSSTISQHTWISYGNIVNQYCEYKRITLSWILCLSY
jgi:hypothetical protein